MANPRIHREHFRTVSMGGRKSCPTCGEKLNGRDIWTWGEYHVAKWHNVKRFCSKCFKREVRDLLVDHAKDCGCRIELVVHGATKPKWLSMPMSCRPL